MAVIELLNEIEKPEYVGLSDQEIADVLNKWSVEYYPCPVKALLQKLTDLVIIGKIKIARGDNKISDELWARWTTLLEILQLGVGTIMFEAQSLDIIGMFREFEQAGIVVMPQSGWILDMGRTRTTVGRTLYQRDIKSDDITAVRDYKALRDKVQDRHDLVHAEFQANLAQVAQAHAELQKRDPNTLDPTGDPNLKPAWEV